MWPLHRQPGEPPCSPKRPQGQIGAFAAPLDTLDQPFAVWMPPRFRTWTRPKGLDAAPHGHPADVHFPVKPYDIPSAHSL